MKGICSRLKSERVTALTTAVSRMLCVYFIFMSSLTAISIKFNRISTWNVKKVVYQFISGDKITHKSSTIKIFKLQIEQSVVVTES
jgi:hypothetical protein